MLPQSPSHAIPSHLLMLPPPQPSFDLCSAAVLPVGLCTCIFLPVNEWSLQPPPPLPPAYLSDSCSFSLSSSVTSAGKPSSAPTLSQPLMLVAVIIITCTFPVCHFSVSNYIYVCDYVINVCVLCYMVSFVGAEAASVVSLLYPQDLSWCQAQSWHFVCIQFINPNE